MSVPSAHAQPQGGEPLFVTASVDNDRPYLGQQITYTFKIFQSTELRLSSQEVLYEWPAFAGFWNTQSVDQADYSETIGSHEYRIVELRVRLFPSVVGTVVIDPAALSVSAGTTGVQSVLEGPSVAVEVLPLLEGAPSGFTGAVGRFRISAEVDATTGEANEPLSLAVAVSGEGNIEALPDPAWPEFDGFRVIQSPADPDSDVVAGQITGIRTYELVLVPEEAGELTIPPIGYTHFDPELGEYVEVATAPIVVLVADADGMPAVPPNASTDVASKEEVPEVRPIKSVPASLHRSGGELTGSNVYWAAWAVPALALAAAVVSRRRRLTLEANRAESLRQSVLTDARSAMKRAMAAKADSRVAAAEAIASYLSARLDLPLAGLTWEALRRQLREAGIPPELTERIEDILAAGETARYTPPVAGSVRTGDHAELALELLNELDEAISA